MKVVSAKCPNCGAEIEVDKDSESTKCEYCKSKIIVDDAIKKYKVELSGSVEVKNLPKIENYMKLGERYYNDKEYKEAVKQFEKVCELDPDNYIAVFKKGISKSYGKGYDEFDIESASNALKNALIIMNDKKIDSKEVNEFIKEYHSLIEKKYNQIKNICYDPNYLNYEDLITALSRAKQCLGELQHIKGLVVENDIIKLSIVNSIIEVLEFLQKDDKFYKGLNKEGQIITTRYHSNDLYSLKSIFDRILAERKVLDPEGAQKYEDEQKRKKTALLIRNIIILAVVFMLAIIYIVVHNNNTKNSHYIKKWVSDEMIIELKKDNSAIITTSDGTIYNYQYVAICNDIDTKCEITIMENNEIKYNIAYEEPFNIPELLFCIKEGEECKTSFRPE